MANNASFHGPNVGYVLELYEEYRNDPSSVSPETREFFERWTPPGAVAPTARIEPGVDLTKVVAVVNYANAIRRHGHLAANLSPIAPGPDQLPEELRPETYGLTDADLDALPGDVVLVWDGGDNTRQFSTAREATRHLLDVYSGTSAYEFLHIQDRTERYWLREACESRRYLRPLSGEEKQALLKRLTEVEAFERFLHQAYLGQKRFSIEGNDMLVPMLDDIVRTAVERGIPAIVIGMAHRGRLNVLAHVLGKPYDAILAEFEHLPHDSANGSADGPADHYTGDVKYHMGWARPAREAGEVSILLSPNPSHLEWVNPVAEGMARARQDKLDQPGHPEQDFEAALPVLLHGDAAFPGQGIVAETLNLARLQGFTTGGTIHIITNNQVGFTTDPEDSRSTLYASDLAKGFEIPIVHVNADDPEACLAAVHMAMDYRREFHSDFLIDLVGYRRWGHNEGDEPSFTQPAMYAEITSHPTVRAHWAERLASDAVVPSEESDRLLNESIDELQEIRDQLRESANGHSPYEGGKESPPPPRIETEVSAELISEINEALHTFPKGFSLNSKLSRQLERRRAALEREGGIDWAHAETLALATILAEGIPVRMTGQDTERGTFSQRHLVLHDPETGEAHSLLEAIPQAKAAFAVYNSPLSEAAVLGFEYGYSVGAPEALVLWEAQFGDFANSAQVIIDQFLASARQKWGQRAGLTLLLPHGYEGQGPEHSSARLERFLQLAANNNLRIANMTTSAQYFHILRRQARLLGSDPRPLVIMTPKSLLRHPRAGSSLIDLAAGAFQPVIDDETKADQRDRVTRLALCSGKVYVDLIGGDAFAETESVAVVRVEELYPFPADELAGVIGRYPGLAEIVWVQEEPKNMGAWSYMEPRLRELVGGELPVRYIGRPYEASPAEGSSDDHAEEQARIVRTTFEPDRVMAGAAADD